MAALSQKGQPREALSQPPADCSVAPSAGVRAGPHQTSPLAVPDPARWVPSARHRPREGRAGASRLVGLPVAGDADKRR